MSVSGSRGNLVIERQYIPRTAHPSTDRTGYPQSRTRSATDRPSPGSTSSYSPTGNGYVADNSFSEVSSATGSLDSLRQPGPYKSRYNVESGDSGHYSNRARSATSSTGSVTSADTDTRLSIDRYQGELFQPQPAPRTLIVQKQVRQMYGEIHPKNLSRDDLPTPSSICSDDMESASEVSVPSFTDAPLVRPRASIRKKKASEVNSGFISDEDISLSSQADPSVPRGILKNNSTDLSDAESLARSHSFKRTGSRRSVRFEHHDKAKVPVKNATDYADIDSESEKRKRKKSNSSDPFAHMAAIGIKPARNDPKRSSGRSTGSRSSTRDKKSRSSSADRSRTSSRNSSSNRSRSGSASKATRSLSKERKPEEKKVTANTDPKSASEVSDVKIEIKEPEVNVKKESEVKVKKEPKSMMGQIMVEQQQPGRTQTDRKKIVKWSLIIGIPLALLILVGIVIGLAI